MKRWKQVSLHLSLYLVSLSREEARRHVLREIKRHFPTWGHHSVKLEVFQEGCFRAPLLLTSQRCHFAPRRNTSFGGWPARWRTFRFPVRVRIEEIRRTQSGVHLRKDKELTVPTWPPNSPSIRGPHCNPQDPQVRALLPKHITDRH